MNELWDTGTGTSVPTENFRPSEDVTTQRHGKYEIDASPTYRINVWRDTFPEQDMEKIRVQSHYNGPENEEQENVGQGQQGGENPTDQGGRIEKSTVDAINIQKNINEAEV